VNLDLTAAVDAAARVSWDSNRHGDGPDDPFWYPAWDETPEEMKEAHRFDVRPVVEAAAPLIEAAVRAQVARDAEADLPPSTVTHLPAPYVAGIRDGLHKAARIARGEA
jgi:hypothetical protein